MWRDVKRRLVYLVALLVMTSSLVTPVGAQSQKYDDTTAWTRISPQTASRPELIVSRSDGRALFLRDGQKGALYYSPDRGESWRELRPSQPVTLQRLLAATPAEPARAVPGLPPERSAILAAGAGAAAGQILAIDSEGVVTNVNDEPLTLRSPVGEPLTGTIIDRFIHPLMPSRWLANVEATANDATVGAVMLSEDSGRQWTTWRVNWRLLAVDPNDAQVAFGQTAARSPTGFVEEPIERTADGGVTWEPVSATVGARVTSVHFALGDNRIVFLTRVVRVGAGDWHDYEILFTTDGGIGPARWGSLGSISTGRLALSVDPQRSTGVLVATTAKTFGTARTILESTPGDR